MTRSAEAARRAVAASRGEIWWVNLDPTVGSEIRKTRPAVDLTTNSLNRVRSTVVVVPLSNGPRARAPIVVATPSAGSASVAVCDQLRSVDKARLTARIGSLSMADLRQVEQGVRTVLAL